MVRRISELKKGQKFCITNEQDPLYGVTCVAFGKTYTKKIGWRGCSLVTAFQTIGLPRLGKEWCYRAPETEVEVMN